MMPPPLPVVDKIRQMTTLVKINPENYIRFDGTEFLTIQNALYESGIRVQFDIMLILYEMVNWTPLQEVLRPWPPADQQKIVQYLDTFYRNQLILLKSPHERLNPLMPQEEGTDNLVANVNKLNINIDNHYVMLKDAVRVLAYQRAIERVVTPDSVVLDLGSGSGVLSFLAARAGAREVIGLEQNGHVVQLAKALAEANQLEQVRFIEGKSSFVEPEQFTHKPTVLVSEIIGDGILEENVLEYTIDVRDRLLAKSPRMIPHRIELFAFAFANTHDTRSTMQQELLALKDLYGVDFTLLANVVGGKPTQRRERFQPFMQKTMSEVHCIASRDLTTIDMANFTRRLTIPVTEAGHVSGICCFFKAWLDETTTLSNSPWLPDTHWTQLIHTLPQSRSVTEGQTLEVTFIYDGQFRLEMDA